MLINVYKHVYDCGSCGCIGGQYKCGIDVCDGVVLGVNYIGGDDLNITLMFCVSTVLDVNDSLNSVQGITGFCSFKTKR